MNRPIVFRVKSREDGEWCHFFFGIERPQGSQAHETWIPLMAGFHPFDPGLYDLSTLGQWPGIRDSGGRMVFEDDLVMPGGSTGADCDPFEITWYSDHACWYVGPPEADASMPLELWQGSQLTVVGNIHDDESADKEVKG